MSYSVNIVNSPNLWDSLSVYCLIIDSSHWLHPTALSLRMLFSLFLFLFLSCLTVFSSSLSLAFQELKSEPLSHGGLVHLFPSRSRPLSCSTLLSFFIFFFYPDLSPHWTSTAPSQAASRHYHKPPPRSFSLSLSLPPPFAKSVHISLLNFVISWYWVSDLRISEIGFAVGLGLDLGFLCICMLMGLDFWLWLYLRLGLWWRWDCMVVGGVVDGWILCSHWDCCWSWSWV